MMEMVYAPLPDSASSSVASSPCSTSSTPIPSDSESTCSFRQVTTQDTSAEDESVDDDYFPYIAVGVLWKYNTVDLTSSSVNDDGFPAAEIRNLERHKWIQTRTYTCAHDSARCYVRVYVLPDDTSRTTIPRSSTALRRALRLIMSRIDRTAESWMGYWPTKGSCQPTGRSAAEDESLWYIFNTLRNPNPTMDRIRDPYARRAIQELLSNAQDISPGATYCAVRGLKTPLYPYQRRSAATMIQREVQPAQMLDPRLEAYKTPAGQEYFYDKEEGTLVREKRLYSEACGGEHAPGVPNRDFVLITVTGILAETMGCGKTLISLAVILATRGHFPRIPLEYQESESPVRQKVASLVQMAAATAGRCSLPWKSHFDALHDAGVSHERCVRACEENRGAYTISPPQSKYPRSGVPYPRPPPKTLRLCSGTLVVVPPNLLDHWKHEISTHTEGLRVLVLQNNSEITPTPDELLMYDIVLFSRTRFEREAGQVNNNRRSPIKQDDSPLTKLHWLRIIVDEGHNVAGHGHKTNMVHTLDQLHIERRWIVSGTPSSGLYGVEVSLASQETNTSDSEMPDTTATAAVLKSRKKTGNAVASELKDLDKLRLIVVDFLKLRPWANSRADDPANWTRYIKPLGEDGRRRKATSLRATLQSLVVRHRLDVINAEIPLPRLYNKVVYLEPTFYDKLSINIFLFGLAVNAITSERRDIDYMFHPRNRKHLSLIISNLREAGFWWAGSEADLQTTVDVALKYQETNKDRITREDADTLRQGIAIATKALGSAAHNAFARFHELGVYVGHFPTSARALWALDPSQDGSDPLLLGISQARLAQKFVTTHLNCQDPSEGLAGAGIKARRELAERAGETRPASETGRHDKSAPKVELVHKPKPDSNKSPKKTFSQGRFRTLPAESPLARTRFLGTASAKLSYLLDRVLEFQKTEKIIIFYDNNNAAYWIAEGLEMLGVDFRIYASSLKSAERAAYLSLFNESEQVRVLLMDLRQASHGLHIATASRVFIVNPIWQPNVESQAIKRAHRIGQIRPVFVETLVLKDTLEDKMLRRRKEMSEAEMQQAEKDLLDDSAMSSIIKNEPFIPMLEDEASSRVAWLEQPVGFFDRHKLPIADDDVHSGDRGDSMNESSSRTHTANSNSKRKRVAISVEGPDSRLSSGRAATTADGSPMRTPKRPRGTAIVEFRTPEGLLMTVRQRTLQTGSPVGNAGAHSHQDGLLTAGSHSSPLGVSAHTPLEDGDVFMTSASPASIFGPL